MTHSSKERIRAEASGAVQGVGFRPFIYRLATAMRLSGYVINTPAGARIEVEGEKLNLDAFFDAVRSELPQNAVLDQLDTCSIPILNSSGFEILSSEAGDDPYADVLPDLATCPACLAEIQDPKERRYRYPFTNCTQCGPRFSIIKRIPYDRPNTTMAGFEMCPACLSEYENPGDRRFHAQPIACPDCGPQVHLWNATGEVVSKQDNAINDAVQRLKQGEIGALKGLGGFHLVVCAADNEAVTKLRKRKHRDEKPFALMYPSLEKVTCDCYVSEKEKVLMHCAAAPIVLVQRREEQSLWAETVAPENPYLGVMLPYTPLHHILMGELGEPVVATSANLSDEPICISEVEALERLAGIADFFLVHNRPIIRAVDDSVIRIVHGQPLFLRRSRGYAPMSIQLNVGGSNTLAVGGHQKNVVAITKGKKVILSQHIGDLDTPLALDAHANAIADLQQLFAAPSKQVICDAHPDYASTRNARESFSDTTPVQHHYAHILACMAEYGLKGPVIGIAWDGTGYGSDGTIWGGEFLRADCQSFERLAHLRSFPLPGGDAASREAWRAMYGLLYELYAGAIPEELLDGIVDSRQSTVLNQAIAQGINAPRCSSIGRIFDAVAALLKIRSKSSYEGQSAMSVEFAATRCMSEVEGYVLKLNSESKPWIVDWEPLIHAMIGDMKNGRTQEDIALGFHYALADSIMSVAKRAKLEDIVLTGGCFQNKLLTECAAARLENSGFQVYIPQKTSPNDGCIALGQAYYALNQERTNSGGS